MEQRGSLDAVLYAALVSGFNSKSVSSVVISNNVATITTTTNHGYKQYDIIQLSGSNDAIFNDSFTISSVPSLTTFTFSVQTALTGATGTITAKISPLGWDRVFTGTNKSVYRSSNVQSTRLFLRILDTDARNTVATMYESMTDIDTGTGKSTDVNWGKSNEINSSIREWYVIGDSKRFWLLIGTYFYISTAHGLMFFGDCIKLKSTDNYHCMIAGNTSVQTTSFPSGSSYNGTYRTGFSAGMYLARAANQLGGNTNFSFLSASPTITFGLSNTYPFPSPTDSSLHLAPVYVLDETTKSLRGIAPGLYIPFENTNGIFNCKERMIMDGKTFMAFRIHSSAGSPGIATGNFWLDITTPWQ